MRIFNLTDVATSVLERHGLVDQHLAIARRMVNPGEFVEVEDTSTTRVDLQFLLQVGAVSIDQLPPGYAQSRQIKVAQSVAVGGRVGIPVRHVDMRETKTVEADVALLAGVDFGVGESVTVHRYDPMESAADPVELVVEESPKVPQVVKQGKGKRR